MTTNPNGKHEAGAEEELDIITILENEVNNLRKFWKRRVLLRKKDSMRRVRNTNSKSSALR